MTIREAKPIDITDVSRLGVEALKKNGYRGFEIDEEKVFDMAVECVAGRGNFSWVAEKDGKIVAAVSALLHEQTFYHGKQISVVQFYTSKPGCGIGLLRELVKWSKKQKEVKSVVFTVETNADPRVIKLLKRLGFKQEFPVLISFL